MHPLLRQYLTLHLRLITAEKLAKKAHKTNTNCKEKQQNEIKLKSEQSYLQHNPQVRGVIGLSIIKNGRGTEKMPGMKRACQNMKMAKFVPPNVAE